MNLKKYGTGHVVMCIGKEINKNTLPTRAGLNIFLPKPPKHILAIIIAKKAPIKIIQQGIVDGRLKAKSNPVIIAEKSVVVFLILSQ